MYGVPPRITQTETTHHMIISKRLLRGLAMGLSLGVALTAGANSIVTFQVDMSTATFDPGTQTVAVHGSFNGWAAFPLTNNPSGPNPLVYSGTTNLPFNGTVQQFKYTIEPGAAYETTRLGGTRNRLFTLPATSGESLTLPLAYYNDAPPADVTVPVTFRVNMAQQINTGAFNPLTSSVYARGWFNGWSADASSLATNDPSILTTNSNGLVTSNVYVVTYDVLAAPGQTIRYKYFFNNGADNWESPTPGTGDPQDNNNNRFFNLEETAQTLPIIYFNDAPYAPVANNAVTFQVDMTAQVLKGAFDPTTGTVEVRGSFNGWGTPLILCTNDTAAANPNLYTAVVPITDGVGATKQFKFWSSVSENSGWETMADNRTFKIVSGTAQTLPVVFFSNVNPGDLLPADTLVTFTVNMTNAVGTDTYIFNPGAGDGVYINGVPPGGWLGWDTALPQLSNNPVGSGVYSIELLIPKGSPTRIAYKYAINGADNEAASGSDHVRYVRTAGTYTMPMDKFGTQWGETSFGQLSVGPATGGYVPVSWLGLPGVHLQTASDVGGTWQDLMNTDGTSWSTGSMSLDGFVSVTNYPTSSAKMFMRLVKP